MIALVRLSFVTLFAPMVTEVMSHSIMGRAQAAGLVSVATADPREFATDPHRSVDDAPYGGGPGMVMRVDLVEKAIQSLSPPESAAIILMDPAAPKFDRTAAHRLSKLDEVVLVCGHYEGVDERVRTHLCTEAFSIGDFVLTGGELPALCIADSIVRLLPGVLGDPESHEDDSFEDGLLGFPLFTRPREWNGASVPDVLTSGDHKAIAEWKRAQQLQRTRTFRPDLFVQAGLNKKDLDLL